MTPEIQELISLRSIVLYSAAIIATLTVAIIRVNRERQKQHKAGEPPTTLKEMFWDVLYGSFAALCLLLIQDAVKPLQIKLAIALSMAYGAIGPSLWDTVISVVQGRFSITKKEEASGD